jgi:hypothetical protein
VASDELPRRSWHYHIPGPAEVEFTTDLSAMLVSEIPSRWSSVSTTSRFEQVSFIFQNGRCLITKRKRKMLFVHFRFQNVSGRCAAFNYIATFFKVVDLPDYEQKLFWRRMNQEVISWSSPAQEYLHGPIMLIFFSSHIPIWILLIQWSRPAISKFFFLSGLAFLDPFPF